MNNPKSTNRFVQFPLLALVAVAIFTSNVAFAAVAEPNPIGGQPAFSVDAGNESPSSDGKVKGRQPLNYRTAYKKSQEEGKPLLVLVSAQWCPPCQVMKKQTIPQLLNKDAFKGFNFAAVDFDREKATARGLIGSRGIPQLIMFEKKNGTWMRRIMSGAHSPSEVEAFVASSR